MAEAGNRARSVLIRNLTKKGWDINTAEKIGTLGSLALTLGDDEWIMVQGADKKEVGRGGYGKTQMKDIKAAAKGANEPFDVKPSTGSTPKKKGESIETKDSKKAQQVKKNKKEKPVSPEVSEGKADTFRKVLTDNDWTSEQEGSTFTRGEYIVELGLGEWSLILGDKKFVEGGYSDKA